MSQDNDFWANKKLTKTQRVLRVAWLYVTDYAPVTVALALVVFIVALFWVIQSNIYALFGVQV